MTSPLFEDLESAGDQLAGVIQANGVDVVLAIANGGVPVAIPVARKLHTPLHALVIKRLLVRDGKELPICAVSVAGKLITPPESISSSEVEERFILSELAVMCDRVAGMTEQLSPVDLTDRHVLLIDNGIHSGSTIRIAVDAVRGLQPSRITIAVPVGSSEIRDAVERIADEVICLNWVDNFGHTGLWYRHLNRPNDADAKILFESCLDLAS